MKTNKIQPSILWLWKYLKLFFIWLWNHLAELGVIAAIIFAWNQMQQSEIQFKANSESSDQLVLEIKRLEKVNSKQAINDSLKAIYDSISAIELINQIHELQTISENQIISSRKQAEQEYAAINDLISQIEQLQQITSSQLESVREQQKIAEQISRDTEEKERPKLILRKYSTPGEQILDNYHGYKGYRYVSFNMELHNVGKRNAEKPEIIQYVFGNDTLVKFKDEVKVRWIEPDQVYQHYPVDIFFPSKPLERIDSIIVCLKVSYQDLGLNKTYPNQPVYYKFLRFGKKFRKVECEENDIQIVNSHIQQLEMVDLESLNNDSDL